MDTTNPGPLETVAYQTERLSWRRFGRVVRNVMLGLSGIAGLALLGAWVYDRFSHIYLDDARITADVISVSSRVSGGITKVSVSEGDSVKAGDVLVFIDDRDAMLRLAELDARLLSIDAERARLRAMKQMVDRQTSSQYKVRRSQLQAARAALAGRQSDLELAKTDFERTKKLLARKVVSRQRWEERRSAFRVAEQAFQQARAEVAAADASLVEASAYRERLLVFDRELAAMTHQKTEMQAQHDRQTLDMQDRVIRSPINGVIDKTFVNSSEYVSAGQRLLMLHDPTKVWVSANIRETDIKHLKLGSGAAVTVDAYPDEVFRGKITRIGNAATSEFALLPTPNPSGNFTKIAQRLPIRIELETKSALLRPGMMVEVDIGIDDR
ncbi:HlyD family secretion protein [Alphaproteobacteria bacterium]|nr:HlyD family secretion protein [Alphaproteobacteria bacterium]